MHRNDLYQQFERILEPARFQDYCPNGLQVEGRAEIRNLVSGVTASHALIEAAIAAKADAILVHHGLFWRGMSGAVTGWLKERLRLLLQHDINLFAYHLPLDAHPVLGNNAQWGKLLAVQADSYCGEQNLLALGKANFTDAQALSARVAQVLQRTPLLLQGDGRPIRRLAWCSGGAQSYFQAAIDAGADAFLSGEISEAQVHLARETGVAYLACGHHASERYGVQALGQYVADQGQIAHHFIDIDNPV